MNALALVIGNANYNEPSFKLDNPVNDANAMADKLMKLGFIVEKATNYNIDELGFAYDSFIGELEKYDCGLFFFAGHGFQIDGINYLTATDLSITSMYSIKRTSLSLDEVLNGMQKSSAKLNIVIIDACRDNPLPANYRSLSRGLATIKEAQGTIIAFSTSPNSTAKDSGAGDNSVYTEALLNHLNDSNIEIEEFFKRVRTTVYNLTNERQEPWYHTSFTGNFSFNSGQLIHSVDLPYAYEFVADKNFVSNGSDADKVIEGLKILHWSDQKTAIIKLGKIHISDIDKNQLFLIGRNILQSAIGEEFNCQKFIENLNSKLAYYNRDGENHLLNGVLFEIYFNSEGKFREKDFKTGYIDEIFKLQTNKDFKPSFDFINNQLQPFRDYLFYIPSSSPISLPIEIVFEEFEWEFLSEKKLDYKVKSIKYKITEILEPYDNSHWYMSYKDFKEKLSNQLAVPSSLLTISRNFNLSESTSIFIPNNFKISKNIKSKNFEY